jgi:protein-disulfide isomerase
MRQWKVPDAGAIETGVATPGFIVGTELVPGALDLKGLKELIARSGHGK